MNAAADWNGPHWAFSLAVYGQPGVPDSCLLLQDRCGVDVNVMLLSLYATWKAGRAPDGAEIRSADAVAQGIRDSVVKPLRELRRAMKGKPAEGLAGESELVRNKIKGAELSAEQLEQAVLARHFAASAVLNARPATAAEFEAAIAEVVAFYADGNAAMSGDIASAMRAICAAIPGAIAKLESPAASA